MKVNHHALYLVQKRLYEEALRALRTRTGLVNWDATIQYRVHAGLTEVRCPTCGGSGGVAPAPWSTDGQQCSTCAGSGTIVERL